LCVTPDNGKLNTANLIPKTMLPAKQAAVYNIINRENPSAAAAEKRHQRRAGNRADAKKACDSIHQIRTGGGLCPRG